MELDLTYLNSMAENDNLLFKEIVEIFNEQAVEFTLEMKKAINEDNLLRFSELLHKAKSSVAIVGLVDLAQKIAIMEKDGFNLNSRNIYITFIDNFEESCNQAIIQLNEIVKNK